MVARRVVYASASAISAARARARRAVARNRRSSGGAGVARTGPGPEPRGLEPPRVGRRVAGGTASRRTLRRGARAVQRLEEVRKRSPYRLVVRRQLADLICGRHRWLRILGRMLGNVLVLLPVNPIFDTRCRFVPAPPGSLVHMRTLVLAPPGILDRMRLALAEKLVRMRLALVTGTLVHS